MRKTKTTLLSCLLAGVLALAGFGGGYAFFGSRISAADAAEQTNAAPPVEATTKNLARGKIGEFRSLTDFSQTLDFYAYYPDLNGDAIASSGCYDPSNINNSTAVLTDGKGDDWGKWHAISTAKDVRGWAVLDLGASYPIERVKVHLLAAWCFTDMIIQVSNDADFESGVTTLLSTVDTLEFGGETVYSGGRAGLTAETKPLTGWNGNSGIDSKQAEGNIFLANNVMARYVRITNNTHGNGTEYSSNTVFTEIEVYGVEKGMPPLASLESGFHESLGEVTLSTPYENGKIYYTLDGSYPTTSSTLYSGAIDLSTVEEACVLRAIVVTDEWQSLAADYQYKIGLPQIGYNGNIARGKLAEFRSLEDFSEKLQPYAYYSDQHGIDGTSFYDISMAGGNTARLTDGVNNEWAGYNAISTAKNVQGWAFLDLGTSDYELSEVKLHLYAGFKFFDLLIQVSNDPEFKTGVTTVFSEIESLKPRKNGAVIAGSENIYDGGYVGIDGVTLEEWAGVSKYGDNNSKYLVSNQLNGHRFVVPTGTKARYVRITNRILPDWHVEAGLNTLFTEIEVYVKNSAPIDDVEVEQAVKSVSFAAKNIDVPYNTSIEQVREKLNLPEQVSVTDYAGNTHSGALTWTEPAYSATTAGSYEFTAVCTLPNNLKDVFGKMPEFKATVTVAEQTDTAELKAAIKAASELIEEEYTAASWAAFAAKLEAAKSAANNLSVTEEEAAKALEELNDAIKALARVASSSEKTELKALIDEAKALDKSLYTSESLAGLEDAIASAEEVHASDVASSSQVNAAKTALQKVLNAKQLKATQAQIDELVALIAEVKAAGYTVENYTQATLAAVEDAIDEAEALVAQTEIAASSVAAAKTALQEAVAGLESYGDVGELNALIAEAEKRAKDDYTLNSFNALETEIESAKGVAADKHEQSVFDGAKIDLQAALDALVSIKELREAIATAVPEEGKAFTELSLKVFADAKNEAEIILNRADATKEEVAAATQKLNKAFSGLALKSDEPAESDNNNTNTETKKKGCKGSLGGASAIAGILLLAAVVMLVKNRRERA